MTTKEIIMRPYAFKDANLYPQHHFPACVAWRKKFLKKEIIKFSAWVFEESLKSKPDSQALEVVEAHIDNLKAMLVEQMNAQRGSLESRLERRSLSRQL